MSFEARCPQCQFLTQQTGQATPCLLHVSVVPEVQAQALAEAEAAERSASLAQESYDEPYAVGELRVSVDRPGPFTLREYVRLQLLRTRVQADPSPLDTPPATAPTTSLTHR